VISFVGAGPGAADLITLRGAARLAAADVVIWASSLVPEGILEHCRAGSTILDSSTMTLEDVLGIYDASPEAATVRLHSGDPAIFGAIQEQIDWCVAHERSFEVIPGVTSLSAAAATLGRELTIPTISQSVVLTRVPGRTSASMPESETLAGFAAHGCTMAIFLSASKPRDLQAQLLAPESAFDLDTPAAIVVRASWPDERVVRTTLGRLAEDIEATKEKRTVLVLVGPALSEVGARSHLYSPRFSHHFRLRSHDGSTTGRPSRNQRPSPAAPSRQGEANRREGENAASTGPHGN
jgi:precorrin-4/cobalt-precorrin-4 C11-methyltransferase